MLRKKLLPQRLACVPWLLTVSLALGWSGEAVADIADPLPTGHASGAHSHATEPYLQVTYALDTRTVAAGGDPALGEADSIFVSWSTSYSKNFGAAMSDTVKATVYALTFHKGETPSVINQGAGGGAVVSPTLDEPTTIDVSTREATYTIDLLNPDANPSTEAGFYWVKLAVTVPDADVANDVEVVYFAKQIEIEPDYILSVNPSSVREDAGETDIEVKVKVSDDTAVSADRSVPLWLGTNQTGLNSRFRIEFPTVTIREGEKEAMGTIKFTPVSNTDHATIPDDDLLVTVRTPGSTGGSTDIRLVDTDKESTAINLSFSDATLAKNDGPTDIEVTATLNGKTLSDHVSFDLIIDNAFMGSARRDVDYTATLRPITIRRRQVSGKATITITPLDEGIGPIRLKPTDAMNTSVNNPISVRVNPSSIEITGGPESVLKGLEAIPFSIREDAESKDITLEVSLQNALLTDETVLFTISDNDDDIRDLNDERFDEADDADRDVDYRVQVQALTIPKGETTGTTTMTVTPHQQQQRRWAAGFCGECDGWRQNLLYRRPDYRRRHHERFDHARGESGRNKRERRCDRGYSDRHLEREGVQR